MARLTRTIAWLGLIGVILVPSLFLVPELWRRLHWSVREEPGILATVNGSWERVIRWYFELRLSCPFIKAGHFPLLAVRFGPCPLLYPGNPVSRVDGVVAGDGVIRVLEGEGLGGDR